MTKSIPQPTPLDIGSTPTPRGPKGGARAATKRHDSPLESQLAGVESSRTRLREHFVVQVGGNYLLHFPFRRIDVLVDGGLLRRIQGFDLGEPADAELLAFLRQKGLLLDRAEEKPPTKTFDPMNLTIFPTTDCNLRCVYCYGNAGVVRMTLAVETARKAIAYITGRRQTRKKLQLSFHGGGEPFVAFRVMKESVEYARRCADQRGLRLLVSCATNGVLNRSQREWARRNLSRLNISIDGPRDIQDVQRPDADGNGTYQRVKATIDYLQDHEFAFGTRSTITSYNVGRMVEMVEFFHDIGVRRLHFEPLFFCGRCKTTQWHSPDESVFVDQYKKAYDRAAELGMRLHFSGSRPGNVTSRFCGAAGKNFCLTPEGYISSCYEVCLSSDPRAETFFYGRIGKDGPEIIQERLDALRVRTVDRNSTCGSCFLKWNCGGECLAKYSGDEPNPTRCRINRELSLFEVMSRIEKTPK